MSLDEASGAELLLKSRQGGEKVDVHFVNISERRAAIFWIGYKGEKVHYAVLGPSKSVAMCTYTGHPWVFEDAETGEPMIVSGSGLEVYIATGGRRTDVKKREEVFIGIPLYSLVDICTGFIGKICQGKEEGEVARLELPSVLKRSILPRKRRRPYVVQTFAGFVRNV